MPPIYDYIRIMADYLESRGVRYWRMKPSDDLIKTDDAVYCLAEEGEEYLIYFLFGGSIEIDLPDAEFEWLDPVSGRAFAGNYWSSVGGIGSVEAGRHTFTASDTEDFVLHIKKKPINSKNA